MEWYEYKILTLILFGDFFYRDTFESLPLFGKNMVPVVQPFHEHHREKECFESTYLFIRGHCGDHHLIHFLSVTKSHKA